MSEKRPVALWQNVMATGFLFVCIGLSLALVILALRVDA